MGSPPTPPFLPPQLAQELERGRELELRALPQEVGRFLQAQGGGNGGTPPPHPQTPPGTPPGDTTVL